MLCPEGTVQSEPLNKEQEEESTWQNKNIMKVPAEGTGSLELNSYKNPKTWRKSLTNFFRNQLRSTKSTDGDGAPGSNENFEEKEIIPEQKWQSLGKMFRRSSLAEHWNKSPNQRGECSSQTKRLAVKKVLSSYFGKTEKSLPVPDE